MGASIGRRQNCSMGQAVFLCLVNHNDNAGKTTEEPVEDFGKVADKAWETFRKKPGTLEMLVDEIRPNYLPVSQITL